MKRLTVFLCLWPASLLAAGGPVPLVNDGIHDAESGAMGLLQEPAEALGGFPTRADGSVVWMDVLNQGLIAPRGTLNDAAPLPTVDLNIMMTNTSSMPAVRFPHKAHTEWLTCSNCHSGIFLPQQGGNFITMAAIIEGKYCGVCHGTVAFSPLDCTLCHNQPVERAGLR